MKTHPAAELFPLLEGEEFDQLAADIAANGLHNAVWIWRDETGEDVLVDGRNRARACEAAGVALRTQRYTGSDPIGFSLSQNLIHRHLTTGQKAMLALKVEPLYAAEAERRMKAGAKSQNPGADLPQGGYADASRRGFDEHTRKQRAPRTRDKAASTTGTSGRSVAQAKRVSEKAPDLAAKVAKGDLALDRAERIVRDREAEQRKIAEAKERAAAQPIQLRVDIRHGDFRDVLADVTDIDAIITDPPYPAEYLPLLDDLAAWADKVLTEDGVLAVLLGQTHLADAYRRLDGHRPYRWTMAYLTEGPGYVSHPRKVQSNWKPVLLYGNGPRCSDVVRSVGSDAGAKSLHKWGQDYGAFHTLVERLTAPGQTVADPFMGSGTTLLAAHALGRHVVGADLDAESFRTATERLS